MPFDPNAPFEVVNPPETTAFNSSQPFEVVQEPSVRGVDPVQAFGEQFTTEQQAPFNEQINALFSKVPGALGSLKNIAIEGGRGVQELQAQTSLEDRLKRALLGGVFPPLALSGNEAQTFVEGTQRAADLGPIIKQAFDRFLADPSASIKNALTPERLITALGVSPLASLFQPSTPSEAQIAQRFVETQQAPEVALQREEPRIPEIFGKANIPASELVALAEQAAPVLPGALRTAGRAAEVVSSPLTKAASRGFKVPTIEKATGLVGVTESEGLVDILQSSTPRILESTGGKAIKTSKDAIKASNTAQTSAINEAKQYLGQAGESGLVMQGDGSISLGRDAILKDFPSLAETPQVVDDAIKEFSYLSGEITPTKGQQFLSELNRRYNSLVDKNSPVGSAYRAIRTDLSNQLDEIVKAQSGKDISPYRDWGKIEEFKTGVQNSVSKAETASGRSAVPTSPDAPSNLPLGTSGRSVGGSIARALTRAARPLIKQPLEFVDEATTAVFRDSPKAVIRNDLTAETISKLRSKYVKKPPVLGESAAAPTALSGNLLEAAIKAKIKSYPPSLKKDSRLARLAAEAEIRAESGL